MEERFQDKLHTFIAPSNCTCCDKQGIGHNLAHLYPGEILAFVRSENTRLLDKVEREIEKRTYTIGKVPKYSQTVVEIETIKRVIAKFKP
ncbi:MAG: hypothetical protein AB9866_18865 [Syntrophobacteraceae bacterium]